ncbi:type II toxin-antitoxin system death-on-curing family toxin [Nonomuraea fuscirosea]|jgi:death on curing protein|uniref:type II toxin-antitoxin system death-on-curing family toxin n=1 Tax=Nonomuraea fuscirosea TaxID=1291556 RepID=UPI002DDB0CFD|nr:type II toxin-antitoxin system death-on-curing family toxin [Nonomuraea fuscirosea]WSA54637.1 type II toxin-antitoxin system death-on-curing family toxin [Nonomuraea fuscirosea]
MTRYLTLEQVLELAEAELGDVLVVRDLGLLDSAVHRPASSMFGQEAYPDLITKAAALLQSLAVNHPLIDGNKRLSWLVTDVFLRYNGVELDTDDDSAYDLVIAVASGKMTDLDEIADVLRTFV